jgi:nudix-type nucleoside diphosphatase (YffH/AdpP family)
VPGLPPPQIIATEERYRGWCRLYLATVRLAGGATIAREIEDHGNAACVLPYDPERATAIVVRQWRMPLLHTGERTAILEVIAGLIDGEETPESSARREADEEAGLRLRGLQPVLAAWTMPGISAERMHAFLAEYRAADRVGAGGGIAGENEEIEVIEMPLRTLAAMADAGTLTDLKTFALLQTLRLRRPELFTPA